MEAFSDTFSKSSIDFVTFNICRKSSRFVKLSCLMNFSLAAIRFLKFPVNLELSKLTAVLAAKTGLDVNKIP